MLGFRVLADIVLFQAGIGLKAPIEEGNRSLIFVFPALGDEPVRHGGVVERLDDGPAEPGSRVTAQIWFWADTAELVAHSGAEFELWYGHTVGRGVVKDVVADLWAEP